MKAWNFEADQIKLDDQITIDDIVRNDDIDDFLSDSKDSPSKFFLVASKGLGKTLILKLKSKNFRANSGYKFLPSTELCEKVSVDKFSIPDDEIFEQIDTWKMVWKMCFVFAISKSFELQLPEFLSSKLGKATEISDILNIILQDIHYFLYREPFSVLSTDLLPQLRQVNSQIAVFVDSFDQTMYSFIKSQNFDYKQKVKKQTAINMWVNSQLGLLLAIHDLCTQNKHIKIFSTIRKEAYALGMTELRLQIDDYATTIRYTKDQVREIFENNILKTEKKKLSHPDERDLLKRFVGFSYLPHSFVKNRVEDFFEFVYRHTFKKPRELVYIGAKIAQLSVKERNVKKIRRLVNKLSHEDIFGAQFVNEIIPNFDLRKLKDFCSKLNTNVITAIQAESLDKELLQYYYRLGLIGRSLENKANKKLYQEFSTVGKLTYEESFTLPTADFYFTHPAMDGVLIDTLKKSYNTTNIIGYSLEFKRPREKKSEQKPKRTNLKEIRVFIATPSDVSERDDLIHKLEREFRIRGYEKQLGYRVITTGWEELPSMPGYSQDSIIDYLLKPSHMVVAVVKHTLGTPTKIRGKNKGFPSGTVEELMTALSNHPQNNKIGMLYFYDKAPQFDGSDEKYLAESEEWQRVRKFKKDISHKITYKPYNETWDLIDKVVKDIKANIELLIGWDA